jgi:dienelactone hydrolase
MGCAPAVSGTPTSETTPTLTSETTPTLTSETTPTLTTESLINIVYANINEVATKLDVHAPDESGPWPVVIIVHGVSQSKKTFQPLAESIASQGAVVYNITVKHTFPNTIAIKRIACAVRFARATAADYGGDPSRVTLVGNSAGANTGIIVALGGDRIERIEGDCLEEEETAYVDAFVGYEGGYDIATTVYPTPYDHSHLKDKDPELWHATNPYAFIGQNPELQIRLVHGDDLASAWYDFSPKSSQDFYQALAEAGYNVELTIVDDNPHTALTNDESEAFALTVEIVMEVARGISP